MKIFIITWGVYILNGASYFKIKDDLFRTTNRDSAFSIYAKPNINDLDKKMECKAFNVKIDSLVIKNIR